MPKLKWDQPKEHYYETGVSNGVLYVYDGSTTHHGYAKGVAWNGLTTVSENPTGAEVTKIYADNINYLNLMSAEEMEASITAYTYPDEFGACDGSVAIAASTAANGMFHIGQQPRKKFCFAYKTKVGNDETSELGYKIHLLYGCLASPSERSYETVNDTPDAMEFTWDLTTEPVEVIINNVTYKPTAHVEIDSRDFVGTGGTVNAKLQAIENALYGTDGATEGDTGTDGYIQYPDDIYTILNAQ